MATTATKPVGRTEGRRFYYACAIAFSLIVFAGFARTYYLKGWFQNDALPLVVHIHGVVMTLWYLLFIAQIWLVERRRVALHRRLGWAGIVVAALVPVLGVGVAILMVRENLAVRPNSQGAPFLFGMLLFSVLAVFVVLVALAVYWRRRPEYHKRFMTLAMLSVLGPAITRLPGLPNHVVWVAIVINLGCIIATVVADTVIHRCLHPVFGWGASAMIGVMFVSAQFCQTHLWIDFIHRTLRP